MYFNLLVLANSSNKLTLHRIQYAGMLFSVLYASNSAVICRFFIVQTVFDRFETSVHTPLKKMSIYAT